MAPEGLGSYQILLSNYNTITGSSELYYMEGILYVNCSSNVCQFPRFFGYLFIKECSIDSGAWEKHSTAKLHVRPSDGFKGRLQHYYL